MLIVVDVAIIVKGFALFFDVYFLNFFLRILKQESLRFEASKKKIYKR